MKRIRRVIIAAFQATIFIYGASYAAGIHLGMPSAVKSQGKKLDKKILIKKWEEMGIILGPNTFVLSTETDSKFIRQEGTRYFYSDSAEEIEDLEVGQILISTAGEGYLRRIVLISHFSGQYEIDTTDTTLEDAFESVDIDINTVLDPNQQISVQMIQGATLESSSLGEIYITLNTILYDYDGDPETENDRIYAKGTIHFKPEIDFILRIRRFKIKEITFANSINALTNMELYSEASAGIEKKWEIGKIRYAPISIGPIVCVPEITILLTGEAQASCKVSTGFTAQITCRGGVTYDGASWYPINDFSKSFEFIPPIASAQGEIKVAAGPQLGLMIYGVLGPHVNADLYMLLNASIVPSGISCGLYAGFEGSGGVEMKILSFKDNISIKLFDYNTLLATYTNTGGGIGEALTFLGDISGPTTGNAGESYVYSIDESMSNLGHIIEYRFDWGDGTYSSWSTGTSASHVWSTANPFNIRAQARCQTDTSITTESNILVVEIGAPIHTVSAPYIPSGPTSGFDDTDYLYITGGSICSLGHPVEYRFLSIHDCAPDSTPWSANLSAYFSWCYDGIFEMYAEARCAVDVEGPKWIMSPPLYVTIE